MKNKKRLYDAFLTEHLASHRQMAFVAGPRQVGKTTTCRNLAETYLNWDNTDNRLLIAKGPAAVAQAAGIDKLHEQPAIALFDELHKFGKWKQFLKGFFDTYADHIRVLVTGSSRLDIYRRGGDSLMGRYFLYRMHPFTVAEILSQEMPDPERILRTPKPISQEDFSVLWTHGGYPEPFIKRDIRFSRRWRTLRLHQLLREDVRDLTKIYQLDQLEMLVHLLLLRSSEQLIYSNLAGQIQVAVDTLRRWPRTARPCSGR